MMKTSVDCWAVFQFIVIIVVQEYQSSHKTLQYNIKSLRGLLWLGFGSVSPCKTESENYNSSTQNTDYHTYRACYLFLSLKNLQINSLRILLSGIILYGSQNVTRSQLFMARTEVFILLKYAKRLSGQSLLQTL